MVARGIDLLRTAQTEGCAVGAFNVYNLEQVTAVCRAGEREGAPVIVQAGSSAFRYAGAKQLAALALAAADASSSPVGVHLDHALDEDEIRACLSWGYSSVMVDGSGLAFEDNVALTRRVVLAAHAMDVWVEGELAGISGDEDRSVDAAPGALTDPGAAAEFVERTGVDALAVAVGNVHGIGERPVDLDFQRLEAIRRQVEVPLVLHGASGLPGSQLERAIACGVCKLNVNTELRRAYRSAAVATAEDPPPGDDLTTFLAPVVAAVEEVARAKIRAFAPRRGAQH